MTSYYRYTTRKLAPYEPIMVRLIRDHVAFEPVTVVRFQPRRFRVVHCTPPMVYGVNGSPRCRMRHQVQLGDGAPGWHGQMPTDRYEVIRP